MKQIPKLQWMKKTRDTQFLKNYTLCYENTAGHEKIYETVSNFDYDHPEQLGQSVSGVIIVGYKGEKLLLCKEFRMGVNQFVYNFPAGHIDPGEDVIECAKRELYEETGLRITKVLDILNPAFASPDLSDSSAWIVMAEIDGEIEDHTEEDEWIAAAFYSREELTQMLKTERFSARAQMCAYFFTLKGQSDQI